MALPGAEPARRKAGTLLLLSPLTTAIRFKFFHLEGDAGFLAEPVNPVGGRNAVFHARCQGGRRRGCGIQVAEVKLDELESSDKPPPEGGGYDNGL